VPDESPEWAALTLAIASNREAAAVRAALGGYVPINHPGHPSRWSRSRRDHLAEVEASLTESVDVLRLAIYAHHNRAI
jgi:hypothetical protein